MAKIIYPKGGLVASLSENLNEINNNLELLKGITYNCPNDFKYSSYLNSLSDKINSLKLKNNDLLDDFRKIDNNFTNLNKEVVSSLKELDEYDTILKRDSIIKY